MVDDEGTDFCEVCGLDLDAGKCPNCNPARKLSTAGTAVRAANRAETDRRLERSQRLVGLPRWHQAALRAFWWLTA